jgi:hypothetical protein
VAVRSAPPARWRTSCRPHPAGQARRRARPDRPAARRRLRLIATAGISARGLSARAARSPAGDHIGPVERPSVSAYVRRLSTRRREHPRRALEPSGVAAIYTSLAREGALAEAAHQIAMQPIPPRARRTIYTLELHESRRGLPPGQRPLAHTHPATARILNHRDPTHPGPSQCHRRPAHNQRLLQRPRAHRSRPPREAPSAGTATKPTTSSTPTTTRNTAPHPRATPTPSITKHRRIKIHMA